MSGGFAWEKRVEFCETDAAGIAHFASMIVYMEQAEHALLRSIGFSVFPSPNSLSSATPNVTWPRVRVECDYHAPVYFEETLQIIVSVAKLGNKSITYRHRIARGETPIATGTFAVVCCERQPTDTSFGANAVPHRLKSIEIPPELKSRLLPFVLAVN